MSSYSGTSQHPVDRRLRELADPLFVATGEDVRSVVEHVSKASFSAKRWSVPPHLRVNYHGVRIGTVVDSARYHVLKRIYSDRQWATSTTLTDYETDISIAVQSPNARIAIYSRWNQTSVAFLAETATVVPIHRRGPAALPFVIVLYSADTGKISTAYMVASETAARIPGHARWLR
jgi:hypothetical protein